MSNKLTGILLATVIGAGLLTGCGDDPVTTAPQIVGYNDQQLQMPEKNTQTQQIESIEAPVKAGTAKTPAKAAATTKITGTTTKTSATSATASKPAAAASVNTASNLSPAQKIILKAKQTYDGFTSFSASATMFSKRNDAVAKPKGTPVINAETKYIFQAPRNEMFNVVKHSISMVVGAKMIWTGGEKAKVKAGGVLGLFPLDLKLTDGKLTTNREWRMDQLDHVGILTRALDKKAVLTLAGKSTINGKEAYMIRVKGTGLDPQITEENIAIDTKTFTIIADEMYEGEELVFQTKITIDATNMAVPAGTFEL